MICVLLKASLWAAIATLNPCVASTSPVEMDGQTVEVIGTLIFNEHSSHLIEDSAIGKRNGCMMFVDFGDLQELSSSPGARREYVRDPVLRNFVTSYRNYLKANPSLPKTFRITGLLSVKKDFRMISAGRGNGYGYHGLFRTSVAVERVDALKDLRR